MVKYVDRFKTQAAFYGEDVKGYTSDHDKLWAHVFYMIFGRMGNGHKAKEGIEWFDLGCGLRRVEVRVEMKCFKKCFKNKTATL